VLLPPTRAWEPASALRLASEPKEELLLAWERARQPKLEALLLRVLAAAGLVGQPVWWSAAPRRSSVP